MAAKPAPDKMTANTDSTAKGELLVLGAASGHRFVGGRSGSGRAPGSGAVTETQGVALVVRQRGARAGAAEERDYDDPLAAFPKACHEPAAR